MGEERRLLLLDNVTSYEAGNTKITSARYLQNNKPRQIDQGAHLGTGPHTDENSIYGKL